MLLAAEPALAQAVTPYCSDHGPALMIQAETADEQQMLVKIWGSGWSRLIERSSGQITVDPREGAKGSGAAHLCPRGWDGTDEGACERIKATVQVEHVDWSANRIIGRIAYQSMGKRPAVLSLSATLGPRRDC
jgi:hypothetical protein